MGKCEIVTCMDPKEANSSWASQDTFMGQSAWSSGGELDLPVHGRVKLEGGGGLCLGSRANSSGSVAPSGSDALGSLGAVTPTSDSALGIGDGTLPFEEGPWGPQPHPTFQGQSGHHSQSWRRGTFKVADKLCRAPVETSLNGQHIFGEPWPMQLSLQPTSLDNPELLWSLLGEGSPFAVET